MNSVAEVVALTAEPKLAKLAKEAERTTHAVIVALIINLASDLHIDNGLTERNIESIADRLTTDGELKWWLTLADVDLLCRRIASGYYGKFYNHFSEVEFNECLAKYCQERTDIHRVANDKTEASGDPAVLEEVGYKMDAHGNLIVPEKLQGVAKKKPMRYLYDAKGNITGENPAFWGKVRQEKSREEIEAINKGNALLERTLHIMDEQGIGYVDAYTKALEEQKTENGKKP